MKKYKKYSIIKCIKDLLIKYNFNYIFIGTVTDTEQTIDEVLYEDDEIFVVYSDNGQQQKNNINNVNIEIIEALEKNICSGQPEILLDKTSFNIDDFSKILIIDKDNINHIQIESIEEWFFHLYETDKKFENEKFQKLLTNDNFIQAYLNVTKNEDIILIDRIKKSGKRMIFNL